MLISIKTHTHTQTRILLDSPKDTLPASINKTISLAAKIVFFTNPASPFEISDSPAVMPHRNTYARENFSISYKVLKVIGKKRIARRIDVDVRKGRIRELMIKNRIMEKILYLERS